jgi:hypothetical protein
VRLRVRACRWVPISFRGHLDHTAEGNLHRPDQRLEHEFMEITGYDNDLITTGMPGPAITAFLDAWHAVWPAMRVAITGALDDQFTDWPTPRAAVPAETGEILVARDKIMEAEWDERGYDPGPDGQGPFTIIYQSAARTSLRLMALEDPCGHSGSAPFDPYETRLVAPHLRLITVVTPDADSEFTTDLLERLTRALANTGDARATDSQ